MFRLRIQKRRSTGSLDTIMKQPDNVPVSITLRVPTRFLRIVMIVIAVALSACAQVGPKALSTGRPAYNVAVQQTEAQQLLLNIVRQRYGDPLLFLDVTSISAGFTVEANASLLGNVFNGSSDNVIGSVGGGVSETPYIFYSPNTGEQFVRQMLTPLDLATVALILQAGWSIERVLLLTGESVNALYNSAGGDQAGRGYRDYQAVASALRDLQRDGRMVIGIEPPKDEEEGKLALMIAPDAVESVHYRTACEKLEVKCDGSPLRLRRAFGTSSDGETMALATRSLFSALYFLAQGVDVPPADAMAGIASHGLDFNDATTGWTDKRGELFRVHWSESEPKQAAVKVRYRDSWFYVADNDADSKVTFALLSMLITLQSGDTSKITPLLSLPAR